MTFLSLERHEDRPDRIRFSATVQYGQGYTHTFNLFYADEPTDAQVMADLDELARSLDLFIAIEAQAKADPRAADVYLRGGKEVRVVLAEPVCPSGCRVDSLADLPAVLARTPAPKPKLSAADVLQFLREKNEQEAS
jgi:hypothetical protein